MGSAKACQQPSEDKTDIKKKDKRMIEKSSDKGNGSVVADSLDAWSHLSLGKHFRLITRTDQIWEFQTQIRDLQTPRSNFTFVAVRSFDFFVLFHTKSHRDPTDFGFLA